MTYIIIIILLSYEFVVKLDWCHCRPGYIALFSECSWLTAIPPFGRLPVGLAS